MAKGHKLSFAENLILGGATAVISKTVSAPIERIKLLVQCQNEMLKSGRLSEPYKGVINCTVRTYRTEGVLAFWRGNLASCISYFPPHVVNFAFKEQIQAVFKHKKTDSYGFKLTKNIFAGGAAGALSLCFVYPLDYCRTRLANDVKAEKKGERQFKGMVDVFKKTVASDGIRGLYRGFVINCVGIVVYRGVYFGLFDTLRPMFWGGSSNIFLSFVLGYVVTISAGLLCYPLDTIKRRMMMTSGEAVKYKGSIDCTMQIIKNEGFMSLMKGAGVNILISVAGAVLLVGFDSIKWRRRQS